MKIKLFLQADDVYYQIETFRKGDYIMREILIVLAVIAVWYLIQAYILPKMGIST
ncbi:MAG: hypothetical protein JW976_06380 [Syntrophaceae bacterium]|nr:hypothetical protein [Syntrophaceae bacterium]